MRHSISLKNLPQFNHNTQSPSGNNRNAQTKFKCHPKVCWPNCRCTHTQHTLNTEHTYIIHTLPHIHTQIHIHILRILSHLIQSLQKYNTYLYFHLITWLSYAKWMNTVAKLLNLCVSSEINSSGFAYSPREADAKAISKTMCHSAERCQFIHT